VARGDPSQRRLCGVLVSGLLLLLPVSAGSRSRCQALKYEIAGVAARMEARCKAKAAKTGTAVDPACLAAAGARLAERWAKADGKGDCLTSGDADAARAAVDAFVEKLTILLEPPGALCCHAAQFCLYFPTPAGCDEFLGTTGAVTDRCDAVTGACLSQQSGLGNCCQLGPPDACLAGPDVDPGNCSDVGGGFVGNSTCLPSGRCGTP
jgi:hypothetical protein